MDDGGGWVAIVAALVAGSVALLGFGLDSLIELASASAILWLYTGSRHGSEAAERRGRPAAGQDCNRIESPQ